MNMTNAGRVRAVEAIGAVMLVLMAMPILAMSVDDYLTHTAKERVARMHKFIDRVSRDIQQTHPDNPVYAGYAKEINDLYFGGHKIGITDLSGTIAGLKYLADKRDGKSAALLQVEDAMGTVIYEDLGLALNYDAATKKYGIAELSDRQQRLKTLADELTKYGISETVQDRLSNIAVETVQRHIAATQPTTPP